MKIEIITPFKMQWIDGFKNVLKGHIVEVMDSPTDSLSNVKVFMWCNQDTINFINKNNKICRYIVFLRRYELYSVAWETLQWDKVDEIIVVNDFIADEFAKLTKKIPHVIYNGIYPDGKWKFKERKHGKKIAMVGFINQKKNYPLAVQILAALPEDYEIHLAGKVQDIATMDYVDNLVRDMKRKVYLYGHISRMDMWLEDKNYLLSTAISEGCPNNVIEAMAKGIKPIVHNWPGSKQQFGEFCFNTISQAVSMMLPESPYQSQVYRDMVLEKFGIGNYLAAKKIILGE